MFLSIALASSLNAQTPYNWEGTYEYDEANNSDAFYHKLIVYNKGLAYTADLSIKNTSSTQAYQCKAVIQGNELLIYLKNANKEANKVNNLNINDHLLSLVKSKNGVVTKWKKLKPKVNPLADNKVYFELKKNSIEHYRKFAGYFPYEVGFFNDVWIEKNLKTILEDNYDQFLSYLVIEKPIKIQREFLIIEGSKFTNMQGVKTRGTSLIIIDILKGKINSAVFTLNGQTKVYKNLDEDDEDILKEIQDQR